MDEKDNDRRQRDNAEAQHKKHKEGIQQIRNPSIQRSLALLLQLLLCLHLPSGGLTDAVKRQSPSQLQSLSQAQLQPQTQSLSQAQLLLQAQTQSQSQSETQLQLQRETRSQTDAVKRRTVDLGQEVVLSCGQEQVKSDREVVSATHLLNSGCFGVSCSLKG